MKNFFQQLLNTTVQSAAQGFAVAGENGADFKTTGTAAGAAALAGAVGFTLNWIFTHPLGQHPAVPAAVASVQTAQAAVAQAAATGQ